MEIVDLEHYGPAERAEIAGGDPDPSGVAHLGLSWRDTTGHVGLRDGARLVAHAGWLPISLRVDGNPLVGAGLGGVLVHRALRGRGLGAAVVRAAVERMRLLGRPVGLLFCRQELVPYYTALGWREWRDRVLVDQPGGPVAMPLPACWLPLDADIDVETGPVELDGLPF